MTNEVSEVSKYSSPVLNVECTEAMYLLKDNAHKDPIPDNLIATMMVLSPDCRKAMGLPFTDEIDADRHQYNTPEGKALVEKIRSAIEEWNKTTSIHR